MDTQQSLVIFSLDDQHYALYLSVVDRVVPGVALTQLPSAPEIISGVINIQGRVIPVVNMRKRFDLPERKLTLADQFIIARSAGQPVAIMVDRVSGVIECPAETIVSGDNIISGMQYVEGVIKIQGEIILIHDLDTFLSLNEHTALKQALMQKNEESI